ncbi:sigma factor-like helix-turn-helix DNA-binding protein [Streptomyces lavendulocolor]|uniref:sigma factor-like helix-turn-helix DNA-binding protein n=1 Tax=Streptomyces lavendulocolor TaxID=67316 RepID=UPI003C2E5E49
MTRTTTDAVRPASALPTPKERRRLREALSLSEEQLAQLVGVTRATVRSWETGRTSPRGRKRDLYVRILGGAGEDHPAATGRAHREAERDQRDGGVRRAAARRPVPDAPAHRAGATPADGSQDTAGTENAGGTRGAGGTEGTDGTPVADGTKKAGGTPVADGTEESNGSRGAIGAEGSDGSRGAGGTRDVSGAKDAGGAVPADGSEAEPAVPSDAFEAFDALYAYAAPALVQQAYLLTGRRKLSREAVEYAFHLAWERWPEVAVDRDPAGWVRVATHEYALSPWHRLRRAHRHPDTPGTDRAARELHTALLELPPAYRRALLLYDGLGLGLPETAAETEASTPATGNRVLHARELLAERIPELADPRRLHERLVALLAKGPAVVPAPPRTVRTGSERRVRLWTRGAVALTAVVVAATAFTLATAPTAYQPPLAPGEPVAGVPALGGPQRLTPQDEALRDRLRAEPVSGPARLVPDPH